MITCDDCLELYDNCKTCDRTGLCTEYKPCP